VDGHWVLMDTLDSVDAVGSYGFGGSCAHWDLGEF
jgi:hypothetical protein